MKVGKGACQLPGVSADPTSMLKSVFRIICINALIKIISTRVYMYVYGYL
jgi:hypothetical protein